MDDYLAFIHTLIGHKGTEIAWWQMSLRGLAVFAYGLVLVRLFARRAFSRQTPIDIVLAVMIGSNLSRTLSANAPFFPTLATTGVLVVAYWIVLRVKLRSPFFSWLLDGSAVRLVNDGTLDHAAAHRHAVAVQHIEEAMREAGVEAWQNVVQATLEKSGKISIVKK
jgi:uncharacterized membrane protein YcaP (DUF421 family)